MGVNDLLLFFFCLLNISIMRKRDLRQYKTDNLLFILVVLIPSAISLQTVVVEDTFSELLLGDKRLKLVLDTVIITSR